MAGAALQRRLSWLVADVAELIDETPHARSIVLSIPGWPGHRAGQHLDVRLTAEDGYQAQRSYSIASAPGNGTRVELTVERIEDGEVSPYLTEEVRPGDRLEVRGPIGGYFVWDAESGGPLLLVAGGSGICPLMAMLRHRHAVAAGLPTRLLFSARSLAEVIYRSELDRLASEDRGLRVEYTLTRAQPAGWNGRRGRITQEMLREVAWPASERPLSFICGPTALVESVAAAMVSLGNAPERIRTERFGPTGG